MNKSDFYHVSGKSTVPKPIDMVGTVDTSADLNTVIIGTGTDFSLAREGDYLFDPTSGEIRRIKSNFGRTGIQRMDLDSAFTAPLAEVDFKIVRGGQLRNVSVLNAGETDGYVNGAVLIAGETIDFSAGSSPLGVGAIAVDGTDTELHIQTVGV